MKPIRRAVCTMFFLAMLGAAFAQHVQTDFDHQTNFSQYKTYSWQDIKPANSLWDARIKNVLDCPIGSKGLDAGGQRRRCGRRSGEDLEDTENTSDVL